MSARRLKTRSSVCGVSHPPMPSVPRENLLNSARIASFVIVVCLTRIGVRNVRRGHPVEGHPSLARLGLYGDFEGDLGERCLGNLDAALACTAGGGHPDQPVLLQDPQV